MTRPAAVTRLINGTLAVAVSLVLWAAPAAGQTTTLTPKTIVGWGGSWLSYSPFLEADEARLASDIGLDSGVGASVFVDRWFGPWVAVHLDALYQRAEIQLPDQSPGLDVWAANLGAMLRPFGSSLMPVAPYVFATGGIISYGLGGRSHNVADQVVFDEGGTEQFLAQAGGGLDILLFDTWESNTVGVRLEAARLMPWDRPFHFADEESEGMHGFWRFSVGLSTTIHRN